MKLNKKYLIAHGCSFTEGHNLGKDGAWPKFLGEELGLEVINFGKGGRGNEWIVQDTISYSSLNSDIAKNSLFVIQLSECLRHLVHFDSIPKSYGDLTEKGMYYNIGAGLITGTDKTGVEPEYVNLAMRTNRADAYSFVVEGSNKLSLKQFQNKFGK